MAPLGATRQKALWVRGRTLCLFIPHHIPRLARSGAHPASFPHAHFAPICHRGLGILQCPASIRERPGRAKGPILSKRCVFRNCVPPAECDTRRRESWVYCADLSRFISQGWRIPEPIPLHFRTQLVARLSRFISQGWRSPEPIPLHFRTPLLARRASGPIRGPT